MTKKFLRRMVSLLSLTGILLLAGSIITPLTTQAAEHSGTFGENNGLSWSYNEDNKTVTITGEDEVKEPYGSGRTDFPNWEHMDIQIEKFQFENCKIKGSMSYAFQVPSLLEIDLSGLDTSQITDMGYMFYNCDRLTSLNFENFDTSQVTNMYAMFYECRHLTSLDLSSFDTSQVTNMAAMFYECNRLTSLDLSSFDTSQVTNMVSMFAGCSSLTSLDLSNFNTSQVPDMEGMFIYCNHLTSLNLSSFDTSQVADMTSMFAGCSSLTSLDLGSFDTSQVTYMEAMFSGCSSLTSLNLGSFDTSQVKDMGYLFSGCSSLTSLDLSNFDTSQVISMWAMLDNCNNLQSIKTPQILTEEQSISLPSTYYDAAAYEKGEYIETEVINASYTNKLLKRASDLNNNTNSNTSIPSDANGWYTIDGKDYWYENGIRQGTEGRGKEIYDPVSDAWYWLDAVQDGAKTVNKDIYQESSGGKWVRYDAEGRMIKGEDYHYDNWYYFEPITGTMIKGPAILSDGRKVFYDTETGQMVRGSITINGQTYVFDESDGHLISGTDTLFWLTIDNKNYWYENWTRQGWQPANATYRGKEAYDPISDTWYWLDNVQQGAKAVSKDVYQESQADDAGTIGKWVRYNENGHMIKGWNTNENGTYYFDLIYGTMLKGNQSIDGTNYFFDENTGILQ